MRVLEVITGGEAGGAQRHVVDLARGLSAAGDAVAVAHGGGHWLDQQTGVQTVYVPELLSAIAPARDSRAFFRLLAVARTARPDVIHGHSSKGGSMARAVGRWLHIPTVFTAHGLVFLDPTRPHWERRLYRGVERWGARRAAAVIAVSRRDEEAARSLGARRVERIENGVDVPTTMWRRPEHRRPTLGFLGRFSREKGFEQLLAAARDLTSAPRLLVAGDGPLALAWQRQAAASGLAVQFRGWQEAPLQFLAELDALVIPSWKEGLPYSLLDALAFGVPTVVTDVGGMGDVVRPLDAGLVAPAGDVPALSAAITRALGLSRDFSTRARDHIRRHFDRATMVARTRAVLLDAATLRLETGGRGRTEEVVS